jgi:hypothetical protein
VHARRVLIARGNMLGNLPSHIGALASDVLSVFCVPGASLLGSALQSLIQRRLAGARDILFEEQLRRGEKTLFNVGEVDEALAMVYRYARAAQEGTARLNLRLMAKVIAGQAHLGNLIADEFRRYADVLASLTREEIILIATLHRHWNSADVQQAEEERREGIAHQATVRDLVPTLFQTEEELKLVASASMRTGLVISVPVWDETIYTTTSLMDKLERFAPFQEALNQEA